MEGQYWIIDDAIIFVPEFNDYLDEYIDVISNYEILYFSNYNDPYIALKNNNQYNYDKNIISYNRFVF